jgi:dUTPase
MHLVFFGKSGVTLGATNVAPFAAASDASGWPSSQPMPRELILVSIKVIVDLMENSLVHVRSRSALFYEEQILFVSL